MRGTSNRSPQVAAELEEPEARGEGRRTTPRRAPRSPRGSQGLLVVPTTSLNVWWSPPYGGVLVLPMMIAPALLSRATATASSVGTNLSKSFEPNVVLTPAVANVSLTTIGKPCKRPQVFPLARSSSASRLAAWPALRSA